MGFVICFLELFIAAVPNLGYAGIVSNLKGYTRFFQYKVFTSMKKPSHNSLGVREQKKVGNHWSIAKFDTLKLKKHEEKGITFFDDCIHM